MSSVHLSLLGLSSFSDMMLSEQWRRWCVMPMCMGSWTSERQGLEIRERMKIFLYLKLGARMLSVAQVAELHNFRN